MMDKKLVLILLLSMLTMTANLGGISIYILDEAKNSVCAREMYESADMVVPTFNAELRTEKPPLHYYFMVLAYKLFGVNEWAARFFSAVFGILTVLITYIFAKRSLGENTAFFASLVLLSSMHMAIQFHLAVPDPYLIFFFTLSVFAFYRAYFEQKPAFLYVMYAAIGLGMMAKGPVALVLAGAVIFFTLLVSKEFNWKNILYLKPFTGIVIIALITLPWYVAVAVQTEGEWTSKFFLKQNVGRYLQTMEGHGGPFLLIPLYVLLGLFPFSVFLIQACHWAWKQSKHRMQPMLLICLVTVAVTVVFFSFSETKLPNYPAPCFPMAAILLGYFLSNIQTFWSTQRYFIRGSFVVYVLIIIAVPVVLYLLIEQEMGLLHLRWLAYLFMLLGVGGLVSLLFLFRQNSRYFLASLSGTWIIMILLFFYVIFPKIDKENPVYQALKLIPREQPVLSYHRYNPAFSFYIRKPIPNIATPEALAQYLQQPDTYIITWEKYLKRLPQAENLPVIFQKKELFEPFTVQVLSSGAGQTAAKR